ncbi:hypothetical protein EV697_104109 [Bisgaardia hudsonensis]|uniref:Cof subfamily protein (Haloacid dehalogenase superfamily)/HAD superfamily hydrolase (TIGR01484 family) n=1 Tax=Bisgaardia hudsonensis TaxID=109472 RepID=A0A4R2MUE7_9PAST|nr:Cof-type HAD-IIB family hydrolase [Bisgaardia hudsonensis]QLB12258.1 hypothetical protein A6A11_00805 [Bisgaardia hudsonensis]TCP12302.1 hypothetical protein EV697_104109 [Bisgaardia hudsonensis]
MQLKPFRAIISDMDGTLLNADHTLGLFTIETIEKLAKSGIDFILATGRPYADVASIISKINIKNAAMITSNGAKAHDLSGNLLFSHYLPEAVAKSIMGFHFDTANICLNSYQDEGWFINTEVPQLAKFHQDSGFHYQVVDFSKHHANNTEKVFFIARSPQDLIPLEKQLVQEFGNEISLTYSTPFCIEVMNKNVSKATALAQLIENRDYSLKDCIAFGDGMNDIEMLTEVGKGCMMSNADPRLVAKCPHLEQIGLNHHESVASYLRAIFGVY